MLKKEQAAQLAAELLAAERNKRPPRPQRIVWCMWLWRILAPDLRRLATEAARSLAYDAVVEANNHWIFKVLAAVFPLFMVVVMNWMRMPLGLGLAACLLVPAAHTWLVWHGIGRRLPEALANAGLREV